MVTRHYKTKIRFGLLVTRHYKTKIRLGLLVTHKAKMPMSLGVYMARIVIELVRWRFFYTTSSFN